MEMVEVLNLLMEIQVSHHHFEPGVGWKYTHGDTGGSPIKEHGKGI
jgi:hypothetical protein